MTALNLNKRMDMRDLMNLLEDRLPLPKGGINNARGGYGAFVVVMDPKDFIRLTTPANEVAGIYTDEFADLADYKSGANEKYNKSGYNMPFLMVEHGTGKVTGHEGRHRAAMIAKAGGKTFPCVIYMREPYTYTVHFLKEPMDVALGIEDGEGEMCNNTFMSMGEAEEFKQHLLDLRNEPGHEFFYSEFKIEHEGGGRMKGSERSEGWDYAAWTKEDMPKQLVGQYERSVVVTKFKVGLVKGYHHFKKN